MFYVGSRKVSPSFINTIKEAAEVTAINNSSFDRLEGEKVWLYYENNTYKIVDALGLTSNAFTGKCLENINKGSSGLVSAVIDGDLIQRYTRDFIIVNSNNMSIDDSTETFIINPATQRSNVIGKTLNDTISFDNSFEFIIKIKCGNWSNMGNSNPYPLLLTCGCSEYNSLSTNQNRYGVCLSGIYDGNFYLGWTYENSTNNKIKAINLIPAEMINNEWYWFKLNYSDATNIISSSYSTDGTNYINVDSKSATLTKVFTNNKIYMGYYNFYSGGSQTVYDLAECYVKMDDEIIWSPYRLTTE